MKRSRSKQEIGIFAESRWLNVAVSFVQPLGNCSLPCALDTLTVGPWRSLVGKIKSRITRLVYVG